jgi:pyrroline-5-carboxylate reductase
MANKNLLKKEIKELKIIFEKFGHAFELKKEEQFDAATALFGSGPAYIFLLQEIFQRISLEFKINKTETDKLVKTLFLGSSFMSKNSSQNFQKLKQTVTSKGGTTAAGLEVLEKNHALEKLFKKAITAAFDKSKELSN